MIKVRWLVCGKQCAPQWLEVKAIGNALVMPFWTRCATRAAGVRPTRSGRSGSVAAEAPGGRVAACRATLLRQLQLPGGVMDHVPPGVAKVERHPGEMYPRNSIIVTSMTRPPTSCAP